MVKAGTKQVIRADKWVAEYRRWVGSGLTQRSYCGQVGLIFTQFKSGVEFARQQGMLERAKVKGAQESKVISNSEGFAPVQSKSIWGYRKPIDFRKQLNGLVQTIIDETDGPPNRNGIYLFQNRQRDKIKLLAWDRNGFFMG